MQFHHAGKEYQMVSTEDIISESGGGRPQFLNTSQIESCEILGWHYKDGSVIVTDLMKNKYRVKSNTLLHMIRGDIYTFYINEKYGYRYLECDPPKPKRKRR